MLVRIISSVILLPVLIAVVFLGGIWLKIGILAASLIGMHEFYKAFSIDKKPVAYIGYIFAVIYILFINTIINENNIFNIFVSVFILVFLIYTLVFHNHTNITESFVGFFGYFYVCFLISHIYLIREYSYGIYFVWLSFICAWGCDTGAYFTGVAIGKHKLIPTLSPKKTIEGSIGGIVTAMVIGFIYGTVMDSYFVLEHVNTILLCVLTGAIGSVLAQIGDLAASAMKRYTGIKDFGNLIPGHGGIIDRFDSVLLTAPVVYYLMLFLINVR